MPQGGLEEAIVQKGVRALLKFHGNQQARKKGNLPGRSAIISVQLGLRKVPEHSTACPKRIPIPHPLRDGAACSMCLFVKEDAKKTIKQALAQAPIPGLDKIVGLGKLRTHYARFSERRKLCAAHDVFLCDDRILPLMPAALGKEFFERKKLPVPVKVTHQNFARAVVAARDSTYLQLGSGPCVSVRIGTTAMGQAKCVENIMAAIETIVGHIPQKWRNVQAVHIKTPDSLALPLFQFLSHEMDDEAVAMAAAAAAAAAASAASNENSDGAAAAALPGGEKRKAQHYAGGGGKRRHKPSKYDTRGL